MKKIFVLAMLAGLLINPSCAGAEEEKNKDFFDKIEKQAFGYFWNETDPSDRPHL